MSSGDPIIEWDCRECGRDGVCENVGEPRDVNIVDGDTGFEGARERP